MLDLRGFNFIDPHGHRIDAAVTRVGKPLKGTRNRPRWAYRATVGDQLVLLKIRPMRTIQMQLNATLGRSYLRREAAMLKRVATAGLKAPCPVAIGKRRRLGLVTDEALATGWLEDRTCLDHRLAAARDSRNDPVIHSAAEAMARLLSDVRRAGFADKDFGGHNVLVHDGPDGPLDPVWADLERAFEAPPDDPKATIQTTGATLARWWVASGGNRPSFDMLFRLLHEQLPPPRGNWHSLMNHLNQTITNRVTRQISLDRIDHVPSALVL